MLKNKRYSNWLHGAILSTGHHISQIDNQPTNLKFARTRTFPTERGVRVVRCRGKSRPVPGSAAGRPYTIYLRGDRDGQSPSTTTTIMPRLPQELIDHITDYIHPWDTRTLIACSLVCTQWSVRNRKHLFMQVELCSQGDLERWRAHIRPGPSGPSSFVEDLSLLDSSISMSSPWQRHPHVPLIQPSTLSNATSHLQSFSRLQALRIVGWDTFAVEAPLMLHHLGPLPQTATRLTLRRIYIYASAFATFVSHFPRLHDLSISTLKRPRGADGTTALDREPCSSIVPNHPRGEFRVSQMRFDEPEDIFRGITLLEPRFRRVTLEDASCNQWRIFWPIVEACAGSLEELEILDLTSIGEWTHLDL